MSYEIKDLRKELRAIGYKLKTKTYSDFIGAAVIGADGETLAGYFTPEELSVHRARHAAAFAVIEKFKGQTFDGGFRVVIS